MGRKKSPSPQSLTGVSHQMRIKSSRIIKTFSVNVASRKTIFLSYRDTSNKNIYIVTNFEKQGHHPLNLPVNWYCRGSTGTWKILSGKQDARNRSDHRRMQAPPMRERTPSMVVTPGAIVWPLVCTKHRESFWSSQDLYLGLITTVDMAY